MTHDPWKYGDLVCFNAMPWLLHDGPIMYVGPCGHQDMIAKQPTLIDLLDLSYGDVVDKDPALWQRCEHFDHV